MRSLEIAAWQSGWVLQRLKACEVEDLGWRGLEWDGVGWRGVGFPDCSGVVGVWSCGLVAGGWPCWGGLDCRDGQVEC